jgi:hypothetical protein
MWHLLLTIGLRVAQVLGIFKRFFAIKAWSTLGYTNGRKYMEVRLKGNRINSQWYGGGVYQWDLCVAIYIHVSEIHTQGNNLNIWEGNLSARR